MPHIQNLFAAASELSFEFAADTTKKILESEHPVHLSGIGNAFGLEKLPHQFKATGKNTLDETLSQISSMRCRFRAAML